MSTSPVPPGEEGRVSKDQAKARELMGFLNNECVPDFSNYKGKGYIYKMSNFGSTRMHTIEQLRAANQFLKGTGLTKLPEFRYPMATRRLFGVSLLNSLLGDVNMRPYRELTQAKIREKCVRQQKGRTQEPKCSFCVTTCSSKRGSSPQARWYEGLTASLEAICVYLLDYFA